MQINLVVIGTDKSKELSEFYEQIGMRFECHERNEWHILRG